MAAANLQTNLLETLKGDIGAADIGGGEQIFLTPYLALACSLLYMMASDGTLEAEESSQLQAVLGGDEAVLGFALRYVQTVPVDQFFLSASELLSVKDKWCILTNVCDALLSDGHADHAELVLFAQMTKAFGLRKEQFEPYFKILSLKNDKSVLGKYAGVKEDRQPMTPHFALAIALLYMLTADGSIGVQEVGQLEAVIGEFEGLQNVALKYVRTVKLKQFLDESAALLKPEQKLYILTNVCDSMLSDGEVAQLEDKLFFSMLTAFGFTDKTFARYLKVLEVKNFKPFDTSEFKNRVIHDRVLAEDDGDSVTFKNELVEASGLGGDPRGLPDAANQGVWVGAADDTVMSQFIARTMQDNLQSVSDDFGNQSNVVKVGLNATDGLNLQKIDNGDGLPSNRQPIDDVSQSENLQKIDSNALSPNQQLMDAKGGGPNIQEIGVDVAGVHRESLDPEVRAQNIHEVVSAVNHRLDLFEVDHFSFLQIGRSQKFTDSFVLIEDEGSDVNLQMVDDSYARMGLGRSSMDAADESMDEKEIQIVSIDHSVSAANVEALNQHIALDEHVNSNGRSAKGKRIAGLGLLRGSAMWIDRRYGFHYVQLCVAAFTIVFASPIDTRAAIGRGVVGPLIMAPAFAPELLEHREVLESELSAASRLR